MKKLWKPKIQAVKKFDTISKIQFKNVQEAKRILMDDIAVDDLDGWKKYIKEVLLLRSIIHNETSVKKIGHLYFCSYYISIDKWNFWIEKEDPKKIIK